MKFKGKHLAIVIVALLLSSCDANPSAESTTVAGVKRIDLNVSHEMFFERTNEPVPQAEENKVRIGVKYKMQIFWNVTSATRSNLPPDGLNTRLVVTFKTPQEAESSMNAIKLDKARGGSFDFEPISNVSIGCNFILDNDLVRDETNPNREVLWFIIGMDTMKNASDFQKVTLQFVSNDDNYRIRAGMNDEGKYVANFEVLQGQYSDFFVEILYAEEYKTIRISIPLENQRIGIKAYAYGSPEIIYVSERFYTEENTEAFNQTDRRFRVNIKNLMSAAVGEDHVYSIKATFVITAYSSSSYEDISRTVDFDPASEL